MGIYLLGTFPAFVFGIYFFIVHHAICLWVLFHGGAHRLEETRLIEIVFGWANQFGHELLTEDLIKLLTWCYLIFGDFFIILYFIS